MKQSVIITARRNDASLIARLELDPTPDRIIGDDVLDRVACIVNTAAADLNVASIEVFPPALVADENLLADWFRVPANIEGNFCFTRPRHDDGLDGLRGAIGAGFAAQDAAAAAASSEPISDSISEAVSEAKSEAKSGHSFADLDPDEALIQFSSAILDLVPSAVLLHTGGGCYAVEAVTPLGLFTTVATDLEPGVITYSQGSVEAYDLGDESVGAWDTEQAVAGCLSEDTGLLTPQRIRVLAAHFETQFAWASALEAPDDDDGPNGQSIAINGLEGGTP